MSHRRGGVGSPCLAAIAIALHASACGAQAPTSPSETTSPLDAWTGAVQVVAETAITDANSRTYDPVPAVGVTGSGLVLAWESGFGQGIGVAEFNGVWGRPRLLTDDGYQPWIASNSRGELNLSWTRHERTSDGAYRASVWASRLGASNGWSPSERFSDDFQYFFPPCHCSHWHPPMRPFGVFADAGDMQTFWMTYRTNGELGGIWSRIFERTGGFRPATLSLPQPPYGYPDITTDAGTRSLSVVVARTDSTRSEWLRFDPGSGWNSVSLSDSDPFTATTLVGEGLAGATWTTDRVRTTGYTRDGARSWTQDWPPPPQGVASVSPPFAVTGNRRGDFALALFDGSSLRPHVRSRDGAWRALDPIPMLMSAGDDRLGPALVLDDDGRLTVVFGGSSQLSARSYSANGTAGRVVEIGPRTRTPVRLVFDPRGVLHAIFISSANGQREIGANRLPPSQP